MFWLCHLHKSNINEPIYSTKDRIFGVIKTLKHKRTEKRTAIQSKTNFAFFVVVVVVRIELDFSFASFLIELSEQTFQPWTFFLLKSSPWIRKFEKYLPKKSETIRLYRWKIHIRFSLVFVFKRTDKKKWIGKKGVNN